jgi:hypothetical protein
MESVGKRSRGHQRYKWRDEVLKDIRALGVEKLDRGGDKTSIWHDLVEKSKIHRGL